MGFLFCNGEKISFLTFFSFESVINGHTKLEHSMPNGSTIYFVCLFATAAADCRFTICHVNWTQYNISFHLCMRRNFPFDTLQNVMIPFKNGFFCCCSFFYFVNLCKCHFQWTSMVEPKQHEKCDEKCDNSHTIVHAKSSTAPATTTEKRAHFRQLHKPEFLLKIH